MEEPVLIVEDHKETSDMIKAALESYGFITYCAASLGAGEDFLRHHKPGLIILDLMLPDGNGLQLCDRVRANVVLSRTPIIALTGLTEFHEKKKGFDTGVDQYLEKPIAMEELLLWTRALLRRTSCDSPGATAYTLGDLQICPESFLVKFRGATIGNLTSREFDLFSFLVKSSPRVLSRQAIISEGWRTAAVENLVDTHIHNLRRKLPPALASRIQSVPGKGFRYFVPK